MFLDLAWYWWLVIVGVLIVILPLKLKFLKQMNRKKEEDHHDQSK